jgi:hypothetical protein
MIAVSLAWYSVFDNGPLHYALVPFTDQAQLSGDLWMSGIGINWENPVHNVALFATWIPLGLAAIGLYQHREQNTIALACIVPVIGTLFVQDISIYYGILRIYYQALVAIIPFSIYGLQYLLKHRGILAGMAVVVLILGYGIFDTAQSTSMVVMLLAIFAYLFVYALWQLRRNRREVKA